MTLLEPVAYSYHDSASKCFSKKTTHCSHCISVQLQVKSHPRVMSGQMNAEGWVSSWEMLQCPEQGASLEETTLCSEGATRSAVVFPQRLIRLVSHKQKHKMHSAREEKQILKPNQLMAESALSFFLPWAHRNIYLFARGMKHSLNNSFCSLSQH